MDHKKHSHEDKKRVLNRLSRAAGHLEHVRKLVESDGDCADVLTQLSAVIAALGSTGRFILKEHLNHCIVDAVKQGDQESLDKLRRAIDSFIK